MIYKFLHKNALILSNTNVVHYSMCFYSEITKAIY